MDFTDPDDLTKKRTKLLRVIEDDFEGEEFARSNLNADLYYEDQTEHLDVEDDEDTATIQTTTDLLNKIQEEDGYLVKTQQGGKSAFVLDTEADEEDGDRVTGVTPSELSGMASQVLDRHGVSADLSDVNFGNWNEVCDRVNEAVGKRVLVIRSEPNLYCLREEAAEIIRNKL